MECISLQGSWGRENSATFKKIPGLSTSMIRDEVKCESLLLALVIGAETSRAIVSNLLGQDSKPGTLG